ncbi:hypothetical protein TruAng_007788 [Truncatella angustata]|nr:hypothetical protein TruAng_007788 [Truncatella angustata]
MAQGFKLKQESRNTKDKLILEDKFFGIFEDYLGSSTSQSALVVARHIDDAVPDAGKDEVDQFVWNTWGQLFQVAQQVQHDDLAQDKLVKVVRELMLLPSGGTAGAWRDLPQLGWVIRDWFNFAPSAQHAGSEHADEILNAWVNVNAFWARLGGTGVIPVRDFAIWSLRQSLEDEEEVKGKVLDNRLLTAAQYVEYDGHILHKLLVLGWEPSDAEAQMFKGGSLFDGQPGLSNKRWSFWASRFEELAKKASTEEASTAAARASRLLQVWYEREKRADS